MVFGIHSGRTAPLMDEDGHIVDPNSSLPYETGPDDRSYISDPSHPEYDPGIDPNLQLRTVRTAAESIAESHRSEARREERARAKRKQSILNRLGRGRTINRRATVKRPIGASQVVNLVQDELDRIRETYEADKSLAANTTIDGGAAASIPFESAQEYDTPSIPTADLEAAIEDRPSKATASNGALDLRKKKGKAKPAQRRNVYLNVAPSLSTEVNRKGEPNAKYPRNKVQTSKYTVFTFLPRFFAEQFRRLANIYFLGLVLLQTSSLFGATVPQIAMLPLVAILGITAIKDGIEDYRRHVLDNQVNNSSVTRLGNWHNVNQPRDGRTLLEKLIGKSGPNKVSKGVKKLREKEDAIGLGPVGNSPSKEFKTEVYTQGGRARTDSFSTTEQGNRLETIASMSERETTELTRPSYSRGGSANVLLNSSNVNLAPIPRTSLQEASGVVDHRRHTPGTARWERTLWKKLEVGDVVLLRENDQVPADLVLLNSSDPDGNAFVETKNLDGETNLKVKKCLKATIGIQTEEDIEHARFVIDSEPPHANLYSYNALLKFEKSSNAEIGADDSFNSTSSQEVEPVTANELLLRGCALRNTDWIIGIVVFTGKDTKIMLNGGDTPSKRSKIEKETNINVAVNFIILLIMCSVCAVVGGVYLNYTDTSRDFYEIGSEYSTSNVINALIIFGSCLVLYQNIVPISLYISIELTKTISAFFIYQDIDMYYEPLDHPCVPKTWGIVDDLGQIEYVFSDKTGTLTQNVMEFKKCSINGVSYGEGITEAMMGAMKRQGKDLSGLNADEQQTKLEVQKAEMIDRLNQTFKNRYLRKDQLTLISPELANTIASQNRADQRRNIVTFFRALALCHTALADRNSNGDPFSLDYKAQSPDEAALVSAARDVGAVFLNKNNNVVDIEIMGQPERYTPLKVLEFNSTRKRMSVIVRDDQGKLLLICKGADSVIYQRLRKDHPEDLKNSTQKDLEDFANAGLRTLCIAYRYLLEGEYLEWAKIHDEAAASLIDRDDNIDEACEKIEHTLTLMGATALEDKLQVGVPEAIEKLHQAGIKLWILTGDKLQTAIEIGFSCNLLSSEMEIMIISADHEQGARAQLEAACNKIAASGRPVIVRGKDRGLFKKRQKQTFNGDGISMEKSQFAVVVDGETLKFCLDQALKPLFLALTTQCETVVCCRVSPAQKALTVRLVKDGIGAMTLSIGDGANDVSMIQEAHVGVGIAGLEGAQASMSADYAIGQFRYLAKLLLVHGHWNTYRIGVLHQVFFYKNLIWTFSLLLFQVFCQANATYLFDYSLVLLYNLIFTSLPVIMLGSLDQDVRAPALMKFPQTYAAGREGKLYTRSQFWFACIDGIYQSIVCFMLPAASYYWFPVLTSNGHTLDPLTALGSTVAASCVISANLYCGLMLQNWSVIIWLVIIFSNLSYFIWITIYSAPFFDSTFGGTAYVLYGTFQFWAIVFLSVVISLLPRYTYNAWCSSFLPSQIDLVRQAWVKGDLKQQMGVRHSASNEKLFSTNVEEGGSNNHHRSRSGSDEAGYDEPRSHDPALGQYRGGSKRNSKVGMTRAHDSDFSFYDPDTLPDSSTAEPDSSRYRSNDSSRGMLDDDGRESQSYEVKKGKYPMSIPQINIQHASGVSPNSYPKRLNEAATSQTALASASTDSFEDSFTKAFGERGDVEDNDSTTPRNAHHMQSASSSPMSGRNFHKRFHQHSHLPRQSSLDDPLQREISDFDRYNDADESSVAPSHSQRNNIMDSSTDSSIDDSNFQTPIDSPRRQTSGT